MKEDYVFEVDWHDPASDTTRKFFLTFYISDNSVEMIDLKLKKTFLKRIHCKTVQKSDFYIGNAVVIFSRRLMIVGYGNEATKDCLEYITECTLVQIKPDGVAEVGLFLNDVISRGFVLGRVKMVALNSQDVKELYNETQDDEGFESTIEYLTSGPVIAMELIGPNAVQQWIDFLGTNEECRLGGKYDISSIVWSSSKDQAQKEIDFFFSKSRPLRSSARLQNSTCCIIKPHAVKEGFIGNIIRDIQAYENFQITALESFHLQYGNAEEFYEIYKGIVEDYTGMVRELSSGRCIVMEISDSRSDLNENNTEVVNKFREIVGPADPALCRSLRPHSLRAKYGKTKDHNAVHCTDLPEDGILEVEFFFKILQG